MTIKKLENVYWVYYFDSDAPQHDPDKSGKWMYFFNDQSDLEAITRLCLNSVKSGAVTVCKHTNFESFGLNPNGTDNSGVCCFYLEADDIEAHKRIIKYFIENEMIRKTKSGRYYNISFKLDNQTRAHEYGADFSGAIKLDQFIDLTTGEWKFKG